MAPSNKDNLFGSKKQASLTKASQLDSTVKEILASEQTLRERKTARLRELRLEKEAQELPPEPKAKRKTAKAS
ncbi:MAG: hypothetical protein QM636_01095 [Rhizobium sp.]